MSGELKHPGHQIHGIGMPPTSWRFRVAERTFACSSCRILFAFSGWRLDVRRRFHRQCIEVGSLPKKAVLKMAQRPQHLANCEPLHVRTCRLLSGCSSEAIFSGCSRQGMRKNCVTVTCLEKHCWCEAPSMPAISDTSLRSERPEAADSVTLVVIATGRIVSVPSCESKRALCGG